MQVHSHISFIPWIFGGNKLIGCADVTGDVRYGPELKEAGTGYVTEHWNTQIEDVVWLNMPIRITSGFQIMTLRQQKERSCKAQTMFKVQQPKTKTKTKQRGIVLFRRKTRWSKINRMKIKDKTKNKQGKKMEDSHTIRKNNFLRTMWEDRKGLISLCAKLFNKNHARDSASKWILASRNGQVKQNEQIKLSQLPKGK